MMNRAHTYRTPLGVVLALLCSLLLCLAGCGLGAGDAAELSQDGGPYFDAASFTQSEGRYTYDDGTSVARKTGVDVSDYQEAIDWHAVAADGIDFAFIRVGFRGNTEGGLYPDRYFDANYAQAREAGVECGAYFFSQAISVEEAREEAAFVLGLLDGRRLEYPVAFDYEAEPGTRIAEVSDQMASQIAGAFCDAIRNGGYEPIIYGNTYDLMRLDRSYVEDYRLWCAEYDDGPSYARKVSVWQYANDGSVAGINTLVDLNLDLSNVVVR
ncbi:MAG: glycoside hydrolase family 25 protein [Coriobacteriales bacterium]|nr:glycoside hydrolase family 25 protein [Coriobacteriales bacterium]